jgi:ketosteroid isomerase-like protein
MHRSEIEAVLRDVYAARAANDAGAISRIFAANARFRNAGNSAFCAAAATHAGPALPAALEKLCELFPASAFSVTSMIIDGDRAAVICASTFEYAPTRESISLELMHFWTFENDHAVELVEYFDTAHVAHVLGKAPSGPGC